MSTVAEWAAYYKAMGFQPVPCERDRKKPMVRVSRWWETTMSIDWRRFPNANVQVMTGGHWGLVVIDCDGIEAIDKFERFGCPATWEVETPSGGRHAWYLCPRGVAVRHAFLWRGEGSHSAIERLGDRTLAVAPPSRFPGKRAYRWRRGRGPSDRPIATAPSILLGARNKPYSKWRPPDIAPGSIAAALASMGVRFTGVQRGEWMECHSPIREDSLPSAAVHCKTGYFVDRGGRSMQLWDLVAELTSCRDWKEARKLHGAAFGIDDRARPKSNRMRPDRHEQRVQGVVEATR